MYGDRIVNTQNENKCPCPCTEEGWCEEYQRDIVGRLFELCQEDSKRGEKYRQLWAAQAKGESEAVGPNFLQKAANFTKAAVKFVRKGLPLVADETKQARLSICAVCEFRTGQEMESWYCSACGCNLGMKTKMASEACPKGKWGEIKKEKENGCNCGK